MPAERTWTPAELDAGTLPGFENGSRQEHTEYRVVVNPDKPKPIRWDFPAAGNPWASADQFGVPTRVECRTVVTYTSLWREAHRG